MHCDGVLIIMEGYKRTELERPERLCRLSDLDLSHHNNGKEITPILVIVDMIICTILCR